MSSRFCCRSFCSSAFFDLEGIVEAECSRLRSRVRACSMFYDTISICNRIYDCVKLTALTRARS